MHKQLALCHYKGFAQQVEPLDYRLSQLPNYTIVPHTRPRSHTPDAHHTNMLHTRPPCHTQDHQATHQTINPQTKCHATHQTAMPCNVATMPQNVVHNLYSASLKYLFTVFR